MVHRVVRKTHRVAMEPYLAHRKHLVSVSCYNTIVVVITTGEAGIGAPPTRALQVEPVVGGPRVHERS